MTVEKRCEGECPECDSKDIDWGTFWVGQKEVFQNCICNDCGHAFTEHYVYNRTEYEVTNDTKTL